MFFCIGTLVEKDPNVPKRKNAHRRRNIVIVILAFVAGLLDRGPDCGAVCDPSRGTHVAGARHSKPFTTV